MPQHPISINTGTFNLDVSGVAGFFGGDEATQALMTIHLYKARRWTGWYNAPGSYAIAKYLGPIAKSALWDALFPGPNRDPETAFELVDPAGPKYVAYKSGTVMEKTSHLAYLVAQYCQDLCVTNIETRISQQMTVAVFEVTGVEGTRSPANVMPPTVTVNRLDHWSWLAIIPILASLIACAMCAYDRDWYCLAMILLGIISNGLTCLVIGSADVVLEGVKPVENAPPGNGMLVNDSSSHIVILRGNEENVNWVTKGRFRLESSNMWMKTFGKGNEEHMSIGICSVLLSIQSLLQLLLIPQGTLFGQLMFLSSFFISWVYNLYLSSLHKEKVQRDLLLKTLQYDPPTSKFKLGTRTSAAVFATLVLQTFDHSTNTQITPTVTPTQTTTPTATQTLLKYFIPNDTTVWEMWRKHVGDRIEATYWTRDTDKSEVDAMCEKLLTDDSTTSGASLHENDRELFKKLLKDACDGFRGYHQFLKGPEKASKDQRSMPNDSQARHSGMSKSESLV